MRSSEKKYDFHWLEKVGKDTARHERFDKNNDIREKKRLRKLLDLGKLVYVLAERTKKKDAPGRLNKSSIGNQPLFNKKTANVIKKSKSKLEHNILKELK